MTSCRQGRLYRSYFFRFKSRSRPTCSCNQYNDSYFSGNSPRLWNSLFFCMQVEQTKRILSDGSRIYFCTSGSWNAQGCFSVHYWRRRDEICEARAILCQERGHMRIGIKKHIECRWMVIPWCCSSSGRSFANHFTSFSKSNSFLGVKKHNWKQTFAVCNSILMTVFFIKSIHLFQSKSSFIKILFDEFSCLIVTLTRRYTCILNLKFLDRKFVSFYHRISAPYTFETATNVHWSVTAIRLTDAMKWRPHWRQLKNEMSDHSGSKLILDIKETKYEWCNYQGIQGDIVLHEKLWQEAREIAVITTVCWSLWGTREENYKRVTKEKREICYVQQDWRRFQEKSN